MRVASNYFPFSAMRNLSSSSKEIDPGWLHVHLKRFGPSAVTHYYWFPIAQREESST